MLLSFVFSSVVILVEYFLPFLLLIKSKKILLQLKLLNLFILVEALNKLALFILLSNNFDLLLSYNAFCVFMRL